MPSNEVHGLLPKEAAILARSDQGEEPAEIAAVLHLAPHYVAKIIRRYSADPEQEAREEAMIRLNTRHLAQRIALVGGRWA